MPEVLLQENLQLEAVCLLLGCLRQVNACVTISWRPLQQATQLRAT